MIIYIYLFSWVLWRVGQFPDQGSNLGPGSESSEFKPLDCWEIPYFSHFDCLPPTFIS